MGLLALESRRVLNEARRLSLKAFADRPGGDVAYLDGRCPRQPRSLGIGFRAGTLRYHFSGTDIEGRTDTGMEAR